LCKLEFVLSNPLLHFVYKNIYHSLWIKPTDALNSKFIGITTLHVSGSLSAHHQEFLAIYRHWYVLCSFDDRLLPGARWRETSRVVIPIKLEFSASVGFIHKEYVTMHSHTILKNIYHVFYALLTFMYTDHESRVFISTHKREEYGKVHESQ
jgi:hypothetical protein